MKSKLLFPTQITLIKEVRYYLAFYMYSAAQKSEIKCVIREDAILYFL